MKKFYAVIGNPPYQETTAQKDTKNGQKTVRSIFHLFQQEADKIGDHIELIYPAGRWIQRSGKGMEAFGLQQINSEHLKRVVVFENADQVFHDVGIGDGVSIVVKDMTTKNDSFIYSYGSPNSLISVEMNHPGESVLPLNPNDLGLTIKLKNFVNNNNITFLHDNILPRTLFGIDSDFIENNPECAIVYSGQRYDEDKYVKALTNDKAGKTGRAAWFLIKRDALSISDKYLSEWQVVVSSANAGGKKRSSQIEIIDNNSVFGRSRVALRSFQTKNEAENFVKYCRTSIIKAAFLLTDENLTSLAKWVPDIGDYSDNNRLLDFSKDLNQQLFSLIGLSTEEIAYVVERSKDYKE